MAVHRRALRRPRDCGVRGMCAASQWGLVGGSGGGDQQLTHAPSPLKSFHSSNNTWVLRFGGWEKFENFIILLFNKNETSEKGSNNNINFRTLCWRMDSYSLLSNPLGSITSLCLSLSTSDYWHLGLGTICWGAVPCTAGWSPASLVSPHSRPGAPFSSQIVTTTNISRHCPMFLQGQNQSQMETTGLC